MWRATYAAADAALHRRGRQDLRPEHRGRAAAPRGEAAAPGVQTKTLPLQQPPCRRPRAPASSPRSSGARACPAPSSSPSAGAPPPSVAPLLLYPVDAGRPSASPPPEASPTSPPPATASFRSPSSRNNADPRGPRRFQPPARLLQLPRATAFLWLRLPIATSTPRLLHVPCCTPAASFCRQLLPPSSLPERRPISPSPSSVPPVAVEIAQAYEKYGAACLSILTDEKYFQGSFESLQKVRKAGVKESLAKSVVHSLLNSKASVLLLMPRCPGSFGFGKTNIKPRGLRHL